MKLSEMVPNPRYCTDKDTTHTYLEVYDEFFEPYRDQENLKLLEIGNSGGGSIKLWLDYFPSVDIYGMEINDLQELHELNNEYDNINITMGIDAYCDSSLEIAKANALYDIIIDDGSHLPTHQLYVINKYRYLLKKNGIMIVEDIQSVDLISRILSVSDFSKNDRVQVFDRRNIKNRFDDIIMVIKKG